MKTSATHPLHVDFLPAEAVNLGGRIGVTMAPGRRDAKAMDGPWERDLDADLQTLRDRYFTDTLVTLLERGQFVRDELAAYGIPNLIVKARRLGLASEWHPMPDGNVPVSLELLHQLVERILVLTREGHIVVIHCGDGLGRSGLVASACLVALGASVQEALDTLRAIRPGAVADAAQLSSLHAFDEQWRKRAMQRAEPDRISEFLGPPVAGSIPGEPFSRSGNAPFSQAGAASIAYLGIDEAAQRAGITSAAPLRTGDVFYLAPGQTLWIGRGGECEVTIRSLQLSRLHTLLSFVPAAEDRLIVTDIGSRNGTWIAGRETQVGFLDVGDEFTLAKAFRFRFAAIG